MDIPGFYYDPEKKKYFKILQHHQAGTSQQHNDTFIRHAREKKTLLKMAKKLRDRSDQWKLVYVLSQRSIGQLKRQSDILTYVPHQWNEEPILECCLCRSEVALIIHGQSESFQCKQVFTLKKTINDQTHPKPTLSSEQYHGAIYPSERIPIQGRDEFLNITRVRESSRFQLVPFNRFSHGMSEESYAGHGFAYCVSSGNGSSQIMIDARPDFPEEPLQVQQNVLSMKANPNRSCLLLLADYKIGYFDENLRFYYINLSRRGHDRAQDFTCASTMNSMYVAYKSGKIAHLDYRTQTISPDVQFQLNDGRRNQSIVSIQHIEDIQTLLFNSYDGKIHLYDVRMRKILNSVRSWTADCSRQKLKLDSSQKYAILGSESGVCSVYNTSTLDLVSLINSNNSNPHDFTTIICDDTRSLCYDIEVVDGLPRVLVANSNLCSSEENAAELTLYRPSWYA